MLFQAKKQFEKQKLTQYQTGTNKIDFMLKLMFFSNGF
jgi:hypothetical protein